MAARKPVYEVWRRFRKGDGVLSEPICVYRGDEATAAYWEFGDWCEYVIECEAVVLHRGKVSARGGQLEPRDGEQPLTAEECHE